MDNLPSNTSNLLDLNLSAVQPESGVLENKSDLIVDHSQTTKGENVGNLQKNSNSTDDFEHVDQDSLISNTDKHFSNFDGLLAGTKKSPKHDIKDMTQKLIGFEAGGDFRQNPIENKPAPKEKQPEEKPAEVKNKEEPIVDSNPTQLLDEIESDYLNPYATTRPHLHDSNEKFISSEDLIAPFKDVEDTKDTLKSEPLNFLDTTNYDDTDPIVINPIKQTAKTPEPEPQPIVEKPVPPPVPEREPFVEVIQEIVEKHEPEPVEKGDNPVELIEAEKMFKQIGLVESLIYWRDVKKSGIVFGSGLAILLAMSLFSLISVFSYVSLLVLFGTVSFRIYKNVLQAVQKTSEGHPFKEYLDFDLTLSQEKVQHVTGVAVAHVNALVTELRRLFLVEDLIDSIKFGVLLYCLTYVGAIFNGMTCVIIAFVALFTLPKVYENNKQSIDGYLDIVKSKIVEVTEKVKSAVPIGKKTESEKDK